MSPRPSDLARQTHLLVFTTFGNVGATKGQKEKCICQCLVGTISTTFPMLLFLLLLNFTDEISHSRREFNYENAETDCLLVFSIPLNGLAHSILNVTDFKICLRQRLICMQGGLDRNLLRS